MKAWKLIGVLFLTGIGLAAACGGEGDGTAEKAEEVRSVRRLEFSPAVRLDQAIDLVNANNGRLVRFRVDYPDHVHVRRCGEGGADPNLLLDAELGRLDFIRRNFSPDNPLERPVWESLGEDISSLGSGSSAIQVGWVEVSMPGSGRPEEIVPPTASAWLRTSLSVTDWPADELYVPLAGTSTVYETGSLQKFWLDGIADQALSSASDGLEIRTVFDTAGSVDCTMGEAASNLPNFYAGDWSLDFGYARWCSVGTTNAQALRPGVLYWTWSPFRSFLTAVNPQFTVEYRPLSWCPWVKTSALCEFIGGTYCMCRRDDLPPQPLLTYRYWDAPGREVLWRRD